MTKDLYKLKVALGIFMIVLGIITWIVTYKYVMPIGSIIMIACGIFLIAIRNYNIMIQE